MTNKKGGRPQKTAIDRRSIVVRLSITLAEHRELLNIGDSLRIHNLSGIVRAILLKKMGTLGASPLHAGDVQGALTELNRLAGLLTEAMIVYRELYMNGCFTDLRIDEEHKNNTVAYAKKLHTQLARVEDLLLGREVKN